MNRPNDYRSANEVQRHDAEQIIREYFPHINWQLNEGQVTLIDIGSGTGDVLFDFIYPRMPKNFSKIVCSDKNPKMVDSARKSYEHYEKSEFIVLNIECDKGVPARLKGKFDHVTSFYCLHWVRNQRQALQNIYDLLNPHRGNCLLLFLTSIPVYDVLYKLWKYEKWFPYMKDIECITSPLHFSQDPEMELKTILKTLNFTKFKVEIKKEVYEYKTEQIFRDNMKAIIPYLDRMSSDMQTEFMDDFIRTAIELNLGHSINNGEDYKFPIPYKLAVIYAEKESSTSKLKNDEKNERKIIVS